MSDIDDDAIIEAVLEADRKCGVPNLPEPHEIMGWLFALDNAGYAVVPKAVLAQKDAEIERLTMLAESYREDAERGGDRL